MTTTPPNDADPSDEDPAEEHRASSAPGAGPTPDSTDPDDPDEAVVEDLDADPEGDGSSLCITFCWSGPAGEGREP